MVSRQAVLEALQQVVDPELGIDIVNLGLVYAVQADPETGTVQIEMTMTSQGCPLGPSIASASERVVSGLEGVENVKVTLVWQPPWTPALVSPRGRAMLGIR